MAKVVQLEQMSDSEKRTAEVLARNLKYYREYNGLTQEQLAVHAGISASTVRNIETNREIGRLPETGKLVRLADVLEVQTWMLLYDGDPGEIRKVLEGSDCYPTVVLRTRPFLVGLTA